MFFFQDVSANELQRARRNLWKQQYRGRLNVRHARMRRCPCAFYKVTFRNVIFFFSLQTLRGIAKNTCSDILQKQEKISQ